MYQENIRDVIEATGENITTLVVPKNTGLKGYAWKVLKEAGLDLDGADEIGRNKLQVGDLTVILKRGEDIPQLVADYATQKGEVVLGVTGDDIFDEYRFGDPETPLKVQNTYDWDDEDAKYRRPALCFINRSGDAEDVPLEARVRVAVNAKYRRTSEDYLAKSPLTRGRNFTVTVYNGDVEITVAEGLNDYGIDTVYSGRTINENNLRVVDVIRFSDLVAISVLKETH